MHLECVQHGQGVAPGATILALKVSGPNLEGVTQTSGPVPEGESANTALIAPAIRYAVDKGTFAISMSLNGFASGQIAAEQRAAMDEVRKADRLFIESVSNATGEDSFTGQIAENLVGTDRANSDWFLFAIGVDRNGTPRAANGNAGPLADRMIAAGGNSVQTVDKDGAIVTETGNSLPSRLRPDMRPSELFTARKQTRHLRPQPEREFKLYVDDFFALVGAIPASQVTGDDLLDYRDEAVCLPAAMSRQDRALPFPNVVRNSQANPSHASRRPPLRSASGAPRRCLGPASPSSGSLPISERASPSRDTQRTAGDGRPFLEDELTQLFRHKAFMAPAGWRSNGAVSESTVFWLSCSAPALALALRKSGRPTWPKTLLPKADACSGWTCDAVSIPERRCPE